MGARSAACPTRARCCPARRSRQSTRTAGASCRGVASLAAACPWEVRRALPGNSAAAARLDRAGWGLPQGPPPPCSAPPLGDERQQQSDEGHLRGARLELVRGAPRALQRAQQRLGDWLFWGGGGRDGGAALSGAVEPAAAGRWACGANPVPAAARARGHLARAPPAPACGSRSPQSLKAPLAAPRTAGAKGSRA